MSIRCASSKRDVSTVQCLTAFSYIEKMVQINDRVRSSHPVYMTAI